MGVMKIMFSMSNDDIPASNGFMNSLSLISNIKKQPRKTPADVAQNASHIASVPSGISVGATERSSKTLPRMRQNPMVLRNDNRGCIVCGSMYP
jgi:hypothetical protein